MDRVSNLARMALLAGAVQSTATPIYPAATGKAWPLYANDATVAITDATSEAWISVTTGGYSCIRNNYLFMFP